MYHFLLTSRYLTSRIIPVLAVAAVALCVALVIVVVSVMTGFLDMVRDSGRTLMGDVVISYPVTGIPWYEDLLEEIEALPDAKAAAPMVETIGVLRMPYPHGANKEPQMVQIWGIDPERFAQVTTYADTLMWSEIPESTTDLVALDQHFGPIIDTLDSEQRIAILRGSDFQETTGMSDRQVENLGNALSQPEWLEHLFRVLQENPSSLTGMLTVDQNAALRVAFEARNDRTPPVDNTLSDGLTLSRDGKAGMVSGIHVSGKNVRDSDGNYWIQDRGWWWMPRFEGALTTIPVDPSGGMMEPETDLFPFVNEFSSGVYSVDEIRVMIPIEKAQEMMHLHGGGELVDEMDPTKVIGENPARATMVLVRGNDGVDPLDLRSRVNEAYSRFVDRMELEHAVGPYPPRLGINPGLRILTWEEQNAAFIGPVEKERALMRTLFSIVYVVCAALVLAIFWAIVYEKTRDIGILRSIGASRPGIVWIFLLYGLVVGVIGAVIGLGLGWLVTVNVNGIHDMLAEPPGWLAWTLAAATVLLMLWTISRFFSYHILPVVLGLMGTAVLGLLATLIFVLQASGGFVIWDPAVYYFTEVPNKIDLPEAIITMIGAVIFSLIGAVIPAARAADIDPVKALRYE